MADNRHNQTWQNMELKWTKLFLISLISITMTLLFLVSNMEEQYDPNIHVTFIQPLKGKKTSDSAIIKYNFNFNFSINFAGKYQSSHQKRRRQENDSILELILALETFSDGCWKQRISKLLTLPKLFHHNQKIKIT